MKKLIYFLAALMVFSITSCKDDDVAFNNVEDLERLPMPMFRKKINTGKPDESDEHASGLVDGIPNAIRLKWYGIQGAAGYEIRYATSRLISSNEEDWNNPARNIVHVVLPADQLEYELFNLEYQNDYSFCIRALHPDGLEEHHSKWYGMGGGRDNEDYMTITTGERYTVPFVIDTRDKDYHEFTVLMNLAYDRSAYDSQDADTIEAHFRIENGRFMATHLVVKPSPINPTASVPAEFQNYELTDADLTPGTDGDTYCRVRVTGLDESSLYIVALRDDKNTLAQADVDRYYNYASIRTKGDPGADILIPHKVTTEVYTHPDSIWNEGERKYQACRLDTVITNFNSDITLAEGQTFLLEGGKAYYLRQGPSICKGFTLKTDPADILAGKGRAVVYMCDLYHRVDEKGGKNWTLGKAKGEGDFPAPIKVENVIFEDIDFECPEVNTHANATLDGEKATGNYFINMLSGGLPIEFESIEMRNCTFQGFVRGFFRVQGKNYRKVNRLIIDNNVFFNTGFYSHKGMGYGFVHGEQESNEENICKDLRIMNNTFYDTNLSEFVYPTKNNFHKNLANKDFAPEVVWNIRVENNTFINSATRSARDLFGVKYVPGGSTITFKRNLIALAKDDADNRNLNFTCMTMQEVRGDMTLTLDFKDNYSVGCLDKHLVDDGIVSNAKKRFSATSNSAGMFPKAFVAGMTEDDLKIKVGETPLRSTELFNDPNPKFHQVDGNDASYNAHYTDPATIWTRLQYKSDLKVTTHEIYTKNIGDQRWKTGDPKWFLPGSAQ